MNKKKDFSWEVAEKLVKLTEQERMEIFGDSDIGSVMEKHSARTVSTKILDYERKLEKERKIDVGDIVTVGTTTGVVVYIDKGSEEPTWQQDENEGIYVLPENGFPVIYNVSNLKKTGRKVDILGIIKGVLHADKQDLSLNPECCQEGLGARLRQARTFGGFTQAEFASRLFVSPSYISKVESGKEVPTPMFIKLTSYEFHVSYAWLISGQGYIFDNE